MRAFLLAAAIMVAVLGTCSAAWCQSPPEPKYSAEVVTTKVDANTWTYTVRNTSSEPGYVLWLVAIEVDDQTSVVSTNQPGGWTADMESQPHFITWMYQSGEIEAGESQDGFTARFDGHPLYQRYTALFDNYETGERPFAEGVIHMPEPTSAAALLAGMLPIAAVALRRKGRNSTR